MKRFLLSFALVFLTLGNLFAQKDTEHWIAPFYDSSGTSYNHGLYFSTDQVTPFEVKIYSNNVQIGAVTISKNDPKYFIIPTASTDIVEVSTVADAFTPINKGIYTKGDKGYFLTLRIYNGSHGEILTSKGKAGIGKTFYAANAPITNTTASSYNFTTGIMATENNTSVTVSDFDPAVNFINNGVAPANITFTLNKGQSYILAGTASASANATGFIGAKISADKPVSVTNGNSNGFYANGTGTDGSDLILDQSVPTDRLGKEFAMIRTLGALGTGYNMEGGIVIATENNTEIYLNNVGSPVATLNEGEFYRILDAGYVQQGTSSHYNIYVRATKNVYLYQLVSGNMNSRNNGGYNYIPPLNCFLPRKIEEIGKISEMPITATTSATPTSTFLLKLNIITEAGATVTYSVDGGAPITPTAAQGPYNLLGNANWVTYDIPGITGNLTIQSNKAVTAGVNGGYSSAGYGGYFAGFNSVPVIAKQTGDCIPGIILEVDSGYDTYQWFLNGVAIPGATSNSYTPTIAGNYTVTVTMGTCPALTTPIYKVFTCLKETTQAINVCASKVITPAFTNSSQTPVPSTVTILTQPTHGIVTVNASTGAITYIPTAGYLGSDSITYQFCGNAPEFVDCEKITLNLTVVPFTLKDVTIKACQYAGNGFFDLTTAPVTDYSPVVKKFYTTLANLNAGTNEITNPTNYFSAAGSVYVRVTTSEGCIGTAKITLDFHPTPVVNDAILTECFLLVDETKGKFNLLNAVVTSESPVTKKFYPTFVDASNGTNEIATAVDNYISPNAVVYVRVYNDLGCYAISKITLKVTPPKRSPLLVDKYICIDDRTSLDAGAGYQSYEWSTGATTQSISGLSVGDYWVILEDSGCFVKQNVSVKKSPDPAITNIEISNNTAKVIVSGGTAPYKYAVDAPSNWQDSNLFTGLSRGQHTFYVKDAFDCVPIAVEITVPNLVNAITPNGDNKNDILDYSELKYKDNLSFVIYDRYGNKVFTGDKFNDYKWDGKFFEKKVVTGTYWYHINWNEPNKEKTPIQYSGWILVKNRE
ncbi:gliding motility-associated C-terminal domain-containing protein [Chryseobacterium sp.]|uniref:T9SS type B sorting domain-containing protein n=1 Tax=Chryseobacterium sp. TaxID=1871047 RepID=UPI0028A04B3F|nr:gliding motility-associated C-terminal domain-containing protein [Chryseobacterium sp.]